MSTQSRDTLYNYFGPGTLPTDLEFGDLIDSFVNIRDEGFHKTPEHGLKLSSEAGNAALIGFFRGAELELDDDSAAPLWSLAWGDSQDHPLQFVAQAVSLPGAPPRPPVPALSLHPAGRVGIGLADPQHTLDVAGDVRVAGPLAVAGTVAAPGRRGARPVPEPGALVADGKPHPLTEWLEGFNAFEVVATAGGDSGTRRFAMVHAVALNAYNPASGWLARLAAWFGWGGPQQRKRRIQCQDAWYGERCDRLELSWESHGDKPRQYRLMIQSKCDYESEKPVPIRAQITQLWHEEAAAAGTVAGAATGAAGAAT